MDAFFGQAVFNVVSPFKPGTHLATYLPPRKQSRLYSVNFSLGSTNTQSCWVSMPDDALCCILGFLDARQVIRASQVCRRWRRATLRRAELWQRVTLKSRTTTLALPELLARSAQRALYLDLSTSRTTSLDCLIPHSGRIVSLHLRTSVAFANAEHLALTTAMPKLESFAMTTSFLRSSSGFTLPHRLFGGRPERLVELKMENVELPKQRCPALAGVRTVRFSTTRAMTSDDLRCIFRSCCTLERLFISAPSFTHTPKKPARLPSSGSLLTVELSSAFRKNVGAALAVFMSRASFPKLSDVYVERLHTTASLHHIAEQVDALTVRLLDPLNTHNVSLYLHLERQRGLHVQLLRMADEQLGLNIKSTMARRLRHLCVPCSLFLLGFAGDTRLSALTRISLTVSSPAELQVHSPAPPVRYPALRRLEFSSSPAITIRAQEDALRTFIANTFGEVNPSVDISFDGNVLQDNRVKLISGRVSHNA